MLTQEEVEQPERPTTEARMVREDQLRKQRQTAVDHMKQARERSHEKANKSRGSSKISAGDRVLRKNMRKGMNVDAKLDLWFSGPYVVKSVLPTGTALLRVKQGKRWKNVKVPVEQLKLVGKDK